MAQLKEIKIRIESVTKTKKLTQAMKMVAAAKFKRSVKSVSATKPYLSELNTILDELLGRMDSDEVPALFKKEGTSEKTAIVVVASDRGLCGGFNTALFKQVDSFLKESNPQNITAYLIGNKAIAYFKNVNFEKRHNLSFFVDSVTPKNAMDTFGPVIDKFEQDEFGEIKLFYNKYLSGVSFETMGDTLLPFQLNTTNSEISKSDFFYEPSKTSILAKVGKEIILNRLFKGILESKASEEGSRMAAMESATDNAGEMINDLTLLYNRSRQAQIIKEISEIVAGAFTQN